MAPATYLAPGVYVEEVPSAAQPIAGVGTNTVGFIGIVPDVIHYPERYDGYDPVAAQGALTLRQLKAGDDSAASKRARQDAINAFQGSLKRATAELKTLDEKTIPDLERAVRDAANDADRAAAQAKLADAQTKREQAAARQKEAQDQIAAAQGGAAAAPAAGPPAGAAPAAAQPVIPEPLLRASDLRPYYLTPFTLVAEPFDTRLVTNFSEYVSLFGSFSADDATKPSGTALYPGHRALTHAVYGFFQNGGTRCFVARIPSSNAKDIDRALEAMESIDAVAIVAAPGLGSDAWTNLIAHCTNSEDRFAILDPPEEVAASDGTLDVNKLTYKPEGVLPPRSKNAAFYFPWIEVVDPAKQLQDEDPSRETAAPGGRTALGVPVRYRGRICVPPSGHVAGIYARTDEERGVHKAPANATVMGAVNVKYYVSKPKQALLNPQGVNCIRNMNGNINVWGARTLGGDMNGEWKYVNVRRLFLFLRESIDEGTQWVVFEPNDYTLWGKIRRNVTAFLTNVWRTGALFGLTPEEAFYVKCDAETNPPELRDLGMVVTEIGVAIVRPAEFVIFRITQSTGPRTT